MLAVEAQPAAAPAAEPATSTSDKPFTWYCFHGCCPSCCHAPACVHASACLHHRCACRRGGEFHTNVIVMRLDVAASGLQLLHSQLRQPRACGHDHAGLISGQRGVMACSPCLQVVHSRECHLPAMYRFLLSAACSVRSCGPSRSKSPSKSTGAASPCKVACNWIWLWMH